MKLRMRLLHTKIKLTLKSKGMSQKQLAQKIGCTQGAVSQWLAEDESKRTTPEMQNIFAIACALGVWVGWLVEDERPANPNTPDASPAIVNFYQDLIQREKL